MYMLENCLNEDVGAYCSNRGRMLVVSFTVSDSGNWRWVR